MGGEGEGDKEREEEKARDNDGGCHCSPWDSRRRCEVGTLTCLRPSIYMREIVLGLPGLKIRKF